MIYGKVVYGLAQFGSPCVSRAHLSCGPFMSSSPSPWVLHEFNLPYAQTLAFGCGQLIGLVFGTEGGYLSELVEAFRGGLLSHAAPGQPGWPPAPPALGGPPSGSGGDGSAGRGGPKRRGGSGGAEEGGVNRGRIAEA